MFTSFNEALEFIIEREGVNQAELAKRMDKHRSAVSVWLSGDHEPYPSSLRKLNKVLKHVHISKESNNYIVKITHAQEPTQINESGVTYRVNRSVEDKLIEAQKLISEALIEIRKQQEE